MTREEKEQTGKYVLQMARLLEDGCYQQEMLLKAVHIIDEALEQEPTTKNDLGVDCIDRNKAYEIIESWAETFDVGTYFDNEQVKEIIMACANRIDELPSVTPQLRKGHWISTETKGVRYAFWCRYKCSLCGGLSDYKNFCPNCGAKMESEDKEQEDGNDD